MVLGALMDLPPDITDRMTAMCRRIGRGEYVPLDEIESPLIEVEHYLEDMGAWPPTMH